MPGRPFLCISFANAACSFLLTFEFNFVGLSMAEGTSANHEDLRNLMTSLAEFNMETASFTEHNQRERHGMNICPFHYILNLDISNLLFEKFCVLHMLLYRYCMWINSVLKFS